MHARSLTEVAVVDRALYRYCHSKSDGRQWIQYSRAPFPRNFRPTDDGLMRPAGWVAPELRFHRMRGEWVTVSSSRQERPFLPPPAYCPLCPARSHETRDGSAAAANVLASEVPGGIDHYEWAVFENMYPGLAGPHGDRSLTGRCEVILYTDNHGLHLGDLTDDHVAGLVQVWQDRSREVGAMAGIEQVFIFENRGQEIGVTLHHAHGQLYAFRDIPPVLAREQALAREFHLETGKCLICDLARLEETDGRRLLLATENLLAYVPEAARYPYEVHVTTRHHRPVIECLAAAEATELGAVVRRLVRAYDRLFDTPMPYIMVHHQSPAKQTQDPSYHWHLEFYPALRAAGKLKYLAGVESGTGMFINDTVPEERAARLRELLTST